MVVRRLNGLGLAAGRIGTWVVFGFLPALVLCPLVAPWSMIDFGTFWHAGGRVLVGESPYPAVDPDVLVTGLNFVYPPPVALVLAPFALLPYAGAAALWACLTVGSILGALRLVGVSDWRLYGLAFLFPWTLNGIWVGAITPLLVLGIAAAWRWRSRAVVIGLVVAALAVAKVFLWPLLVWLLATRRSRSAGIAVAAAVSGTLVAWAMLDFAGLADYAAILRTLTAVEQHTTYSVSALVLSLGGSTAVAQVAALAAGGLALGAALAVGRRPDGDLPALVAALAASLLLTPILWPHYLAILLVPLAVARPRLDRVWLAPLSLWLVTGASDGGVWKIALALGLVVAVAWGARCQTLAAVRAPASVPAS